jgi:hypothetical protein
VTATTFIHATRAGVNIPQFTWNFTTDNTTFLANYTDNLPYPNFAVADYARYPIPATGSQTTAVTTNGLRLTAGAGNYMSYSANVNFNPLKGSIEVTLDIDQLKAATGAFYLFDIFSGYTPGTTLPATTPNRIYLMVSDTGILKFYIYGATSTDRNYVTFSKTNLTTTGIGTIIIDWDMTQADPMITLSEIVGGTKIQRATRSNTNKPQPYFTPSDNFYIGSQVGGALIIQTTSPCSVTQPCLSPTQYPGYIRKFVIRGQ